jgi:ParB family chromosome partitioning protein
MHAPGHRLDQIRVDHIRANPRQPRSSFDSGKIADLAANIRSVGSLLQPIVLRSVADGFEVVAGERRLRAVQMLGWSEVPAIVLDDVDDRAAYLLAVAENGARQDLDPMEEARALVYMRDALGMETPSIEQHAGLPPGEAAWRMELVKLRPDLQHMVARRQLTRTAGFYLSRLSLNGQRRVVDALTKAPMDTNQVKALTDLVLAEESSPEMFPEVQRRTAEEARAAERWRIALDRAVDALRRVEDVGDGVIGQALAHELEVAEQRVQLLLRGWGRVRRGLRARRVGLELKGEAG